ncbi:MAG: trimethylamine methyltransferase family protein [Anaerolineales bacterium]
MENSKVQSDYYRILPRQGIDAIHRASIAILEKTGITVKHNEGLQLLEAAGASVDWDLQRARLPEYLVEQCLKTVPHSLLLGSRTPSRDLTVAHGLLPVTRNGGGSDLTLDLDTDQMRPLIAADLKDYIRLMDGLEHIDFLAPVYARDYPEHIRDVLVLKTMFENTDKHVHMRAYSKKSLEIILEMATIVAGSFENLKQRPVLSLLEAPVSPLTFLDITVDALFLCGQYGIPLELCCMPIAGGTGPITLAGNVALANAECLACTVISQLANPGAPLEFAPRCMILDMKTTVGLTGSIEGAMMAAVGAQLARELYNVPVSLHGPWTDSILPDEQSNLERTNFAFLAGLAGTNVFSGAGMIEQGKTFSHLQLVMDDEIHGIVKLVLSGMDTDEEHTAFDAVDRAGPGGNYLIDDLTFKYFKTERYFPRIFLRETRSTWEAKGAKPFRERARERVKHILATHEPTPLDEAVSREIAVLVKASEKILA